MCVCVCVWTVEGTLIYSANNGHQWTANDNYFIYLLKNENLQKQLSKLTYGHTHLLKFKVHFKGKWE